MLFVGFYFFIKTLNAVVLFTNMCQLSALDYTAKCIISIEGQILLSIFNNTVSQSSFPPPSTQRWLMGA